MNIMNDFKRKRILVIGDVMLDTYFVGNINRISPEAPVPVFLKKNQRSVLGGAANVAANLVAAGQSVSVMSVVGSDDAGNNLLAHLMDAGIDTSYVLIEEKKTTEKTRFVAENGQQVMRLDVEDPAEISPEVCTRLLETLRDEIGKFDLVVISDYMKGLLTYDFTQGIISVAKEEGIRVIIDVKDRACSKYAGAYLLKPNQSELRMLTGMPVSTESEMILASKELLKRCSCDYVLATCGSRGMTLVGKNTQFTVKSVGKEVFDVTGAGDTTIAYLSACIANNFAMNDSVYISNCAAGIQVGKIGTSSVYVHEVREALANIEHGFMNKILSGYSIDNFRNEHSTKKIVFTNGCFDILHIGHVRYLQEAKKLGDVLVVGLNSDSSVRHLKGDDRPINSERERCEILCALSCVDYVIIFDEDTPYNLIKTIQPDVLVKGGDYRPDEVVGKDIVEERGGQLVLVPFVEGQSTTNIINKMRNK